MTTQAERLSAALADRYRIERELGQGGMATVYLAADLKHDRKVALKVLKPELAAVLGAERFVVEIKTTAALQHPHILPLFDSGTADGFLYYVMPYIEGETLRGRLNRETQLSVDEAVRIASDVASALHYAHQHGVIHRDIKPENILLHDGRPMVADFGIALAVSAAAGGRMTETGLSLGTPHYMSPEQATAEKDISARSDVYSIGSVLFEMLTGQPPHLGGSAQQIIMKIITETPQPVTALRKSVPANVAAAVAKSLEKLPADRFESAARFAEALGNPAFTTQRAEAAAAIAGAGGRRSRALVASLAVVATLTSIAALWGWMRAAPETQTVRLDLSLGGIDASNSDVAISPDGSMIAVGGTKDGVNAIFLRRIGEPDFQKVLGTDDGIRPTFSPDSRWIAFRKTTDNSLVKAAVSGGQALTLVPGSQNAVFEAHWGTDDQIVVNAQQGVYIVPAAGGAPVPLPKAGGRQSFLLPDGSGVLYSRNGAVSVLDLATDSSSVLVPQARHPFYVSTGHLLYIAEDGGLFAVPFDLRGHRVTGAAVRVLDRVAASALFRGFSVSANGVLLHHEGTSTFGIFAGHTLLVVSDLGGRADTLRLPPNRRLRPRFAPSGRAIVFEQLDAAAAGRSDIFTFDLVSGTNTPITFATDNDHDEPIWSPDGKQILFTKSNGDAAEDLYIKPADNSADERLVVTMPGDQNASDWLDDGTIVFNSAGNGNGAGQDDIFTYSLTDSGKPRPYLEAPWVEGGAAVSPDKKLAAFVSTESGQPEVWLRTWPKAEGKWRVSFHGRVGSPRWSPDGRDVYFWNINVGTPDSLFRVRVDRTPGVVVRSAEPLLALDLAGPYEWDLSPDGKRIIGAVVQSATAAGAAGGAAGSSRYLVVLNWFTELKAMTDPGARK